MDSNKNTGRGPHVQRERHRGQRAGWLRAAVLGADDGIVSVASLSIGVVASGASRTVVLTAAVAALVAGAMSMAAGEYVSVSSQRDTELGDLARERDELADDPAGETHELAAIYRRRGCSAELASQVAEALMGTRSHRSPRPRRIGHPGTDTSSAGAGCALVCVELRFWCHRPGTDLAHSTRWQAGSSTHRRIAHRSRAARHRRSPGWRSDSLTSSAPCRAVGQRRNRHNSARRSPLPQHNRITSALGSTSRYSRWASHNLVITACAN